MERAPGRDVGEDPSTPSLFFFCFFVLVLLRLTEEEKKAGERRDWSRLRLLLSSFFHLVSDSSEKHTHMCKRGSTH